MESALEQAYRRMFGRNGGAPLARIVSDYVPNLYAPDDGLTVERIHYPFRFPLIDRYLDGALDTPLNERQSSAANDLAGLLILAAARFPDNFPNAGPAAFALLDRSRATGDCRPQLNLAFLLSSDPNNPRDDDVAMEFEKATRACSGDPTPLWLLGQFQSDRAFTTEIGEGIRGQELLLAERLRPTLRDFQSPQDTNAWLAARMVGRGGRRASHRLSRH